MAAETLIEDVHLGRNRASILGSVKPSRTAASAYANGMDQLGSVDLRREKSRGDISLGLDAGLVARGAVSAAPLRKHILEDHQCIMIYGGHRSEEVNP